MPLIANRYEVIEPVGQGAYGVVFSAKDHTTQELVALKKVIDVFQDSKDAQRTLREVKLLYHFRNHQNITNIKNLFPNSPELKHLYIVLELMDGDLSSLIKDPSVQLSSQDLKFMMYQITRGVAFIHKCKVVHRDLRPKNLLTKNKTIVKIGDLGMGRAEGVNSSLLEYTTTTWYRAPEGFFPSMEYTSEVDIWSVACIFVEMLLRRIFIQGKDEGEQFQLIINTFGFPPEDFIQRMSEKDRSTLSQFSAKESSIPLSELLPNADPSFIDLLQHMFYWNPDKRITAEQALHHPYFQEFVNYYDSEVEAKPFMFDLEGETMTSEDTKKLLLEELALYPQN